MILKKFVHKINLPGICVDNEGDNKHLTSGFKNRVKECVFDVWRSPGSKPTNKHVQ